MKGIAVVAHGSATADLKALKAQGIIGVAFNPSLMGCDYYADASDLLARLADLELFAQFQVEADQLVTLLPMIERARVRLLIDHCGRPEPKYGLQQPGFQALLALGREGRAVVKLSGHAKFAHLPYPYADAQPFVRALVDAFTLDGCVWGSDWPFLRATDRLDYGPLLKLAETLFPDANDRRKLFWETPARLLGVGQ